MLFIIMRFGCFNEKELNSLVFRRGNVKVVFIEGKFCFLLERDKYVFFKEKGYW